MTTREDVLIEISMVSYLCIALYTAISKRSNAFITIFCVISLDVHAAFLNLPSTRHTRHGTAHKAGMIVIALTLLAITLHDDNHDFILVNLAWFVLLSKILDVFSDQNTLTEELFTLVASVCITTATLHFQKLASRG